MVVDSVNKEDSLEAGLALVSITVMKDQICKFNLHFDSFKPYHYLMMKHFHFFSSFCHTCLDHFATAIVVTVVL